MAKGGREYISKEELATVERLKSEKKELLEIERQELQQIRDMEQAYKDSGDESLKLTAAMKERLRVAQNEETIKDNTLNLEKQLAAQARNLDGTKSKQADLALLQLQNLKKSLKDQTLTTEQFESQVAIVEQIAAGRATEKEIQDALNSLGDDATEEMKKYLETQKHTAKQQKLGKDLMSGFDDLLGGMMGKVKDVLLNPLTAVFLILKDYTGVTKEIGKEFGALGMQNKEFKADLVAARTEAVELGKGIEDIIAVTKTLTDEFGFSLDKAKDLSVTLIDTSMALGLSTDEGTKLFGVLSQVGGLSEETTEQFMKQTALLAQAEGVAPQAVLRDMANSSEAIAKFSDGSAEGIAKAAIMAKKLGTTLDTVAGIAEGLLDFQTSLNAEIEASMLLGRRVNFQKARELALNNDIEGAMAAVVDQLGSSEEFNKLNVIQRKALASAIGVSVDQLAKFVNNEEKAKTLWEAISEQPGMEELMGEDSMDAIAKIVADFAKLGAHLAETIGPSIVSILSWLGGWAEWLLENQTILATIAGVLVGMKTMAMMIAIANIWTTAMNSFKLIPFAGIAMGIAAAIGAVSMLNSDIDSAGDLDSPADGKTRVATKEGGLFEMSPKDDLVAAPGASKIFANANKPVEIEVDAGSTLASPSVAKSRRVDLSVERQSAENLRAINATNDKLDQLVGSQGKLVENMEGYFGFGGSAIRGIGNRVGDKVNFSKT